MVNKDTAAEEADVASFPSPRLLFFFAVAWGLLLVRPPFHLHYYVLGERARFWAVKHDVAPHGRVMERWPRDNQSRLRLGRLEFVDQVFGPESIEFDPAGRGPYAGLADGRIVRWMGAAVGWETFAVVTPNWSEEVCANGVESTTPKQHRHEKRCGRPLGLRFDEATGRLYIADSYHGLLVVGPNGGVATPLASRDAQGTPILFANDLDVHSNGSVFFTDTSTRYDRRNHIFAVLEGEATGRLLRYDPATGAAHVVLKGLAFPNGVQLSKDQSFLLVAETTNCRIMRYWIEGPKSGQLEVFANLPGFPDNIRMNQNGQFWVAIDCCNSPRNEVSSRNPWMRNVYFRLPLKLSFLARKAFPNMHSMIALFGEDGDVAIDALEDAQGEVVKLVSEVREVDGKLWVGTVAHNRIFTLPYPII